MGWRDTERLGKIGRGATAEAIAAACKSLVMPMRMLGLGFSVIVGVLFRTRFVVSGVQLKRSMGVAADESQRQKQDQATQEHGSLHGTSTSLRRI